MNDGFRLSIRAEGDIPLRRLDRVTGNGEHAVLAQLRAGEHVVILKSTKPDWLVLSILHGRSDLARRLNEIENEG
ncbi:MAG: hypothetical protein KDK24_10590 [Pseudooceanicola sp.]|nr:hypothetical protein [Pseudooceanicola sp.]